MADRTCQDIKELGESLRALEKSLATIAQKQDSQFQELRASATELKKLILLNSRTSPQCTADSEQPSAELSSSEVSTDLKTAEIQRFDGPTKAEDHEHEHHPAPNSTSIIEEILPEETGSKLSASPPPTWKYDVFVSFRGADTRRGFVSHLFQAFKREDIKCYRDVDGNERGQKVESMLIDAIRHSKTAIILLSPNYADSKWCLQELVDIFTWNKQHRIHGHEVLPIFYDVNSSDVRHLGGMIGEAFRRCIDRNGKYNKDIWANALKKAGRISSWSSSNGDEAHLIQEIVEVLLEKVAYSRSPLLVKSSIAPNDNVSHLRSMLDMTSNDIVRTVGICGTEGVGKTTLANAACVHLHNLFEGRVILLEDIHTVETMQDLLEIQSKIAAELLKDKWFRLSEDTKKNALEMRMRLSQKKVLIVLDNVTTLEQVELVLGKDHEKFLGPGSRVVITSRDRELLDKLQVDDVYIVPPLNHDDSLKLFYHYAFMGRQEFNVMKEYDDLSKNIVHYSAGLPLVLESLGNSLSNAPKTEWYTKLRDLVRSSHLLDTKVCKCGPFGGPGRDESRWDDREHCDVRGMELVIVDSVIKSIRVTYDNYGHPVGPLFHGCSSSSSTILPQKIELDYPYEYLRAISGYIGKTEASEVSVRSLTFHSNTRTLGPFGDESKTGQPFYTHPIGSKIVGFFGAGDSELQCIGVHSKQVSHTYPHHQVVGPFGKNTGVDWDDGTFTDIRKINITHDSRYIIAINCVYDNNGIPVKKLSQGSQSSIYNYKQVEVTLNYPTEFLVSVSGCYEQDSADSTSYIKSLKFRTNLKTHGPYGWFGKGLTFSMPLELGKIVGFFGTYGVNNVKSIGAYVVPVYHVHPLTTIEPFGAVFSNTWDDGKHSGVKRIDIYHGQAINYMRFTYIDRNGRTVQGRKFGSPDTDGFGVKEEVVELDNSKEYLVSISGRFKSFGETKYISSLSFETNLKRELGPYGEKNSRYKDFYFKSNIGKIVGFHGTFNPESHGYTLAKKRESRGYSIGPHFQLL